MNDSMSIFFCLIYLMKFRSILKEQVLESGENGHVKFDEKGDRLNSDYDIFNIQRVR